MDSPLRSTALTPPSTRSACWPYEQNASSSGFHRIYQLTARGSGDFFQAGPVECPACPGFPDAPERAFAAGGSGREPGLALLVCVSFRVFVSSPEPFHHVGERGAQRAAFQLRTGGG